MLGWVFIFLVGAVIAGLLGFGVIASTFASIALVVFYVFLALLAISILASLFAPSVRS